MNRSVIGQHAVFSSGNESELLPTTAERNRVVGTGEIAGDVGIGTMDVSTSGTSSSKRDQGRSTSPCRRTAPHRQGDDEGNTEFIGRRQLNTRDFGGVSHDARLPPSTSRQCSVDVGRMERGFDCIAASLNNLAMQPRVRQTHAIDDDIINTHHLLGESNLNIMANGGLQKAYRLKLADLEKERIISIAFDKLLFPNPIDEKNTNTIDRD